MRGFVGVSQGLFGESDSIGWRVRYARMGFHEEREGGRDDEQQEMQEDGDRISGGIVQLANDSIFAMCWMRDQKLVAQ